MLCASFSVLPSSSFCLFLALQTLFFHNRFCCNLSNFLLSLGPYVFVLVRYHFESHHSLFVLHLIVSISTNLVYLFFGLSWTQCSHLAAIPHPASPSYSHVRRSIHSHRHTHTLPCLLGLAAPVCPALARTRLGFLLWNLGNVGVV